MMKEGRHEGAAHLAAVNEVTRAILAGQPTLRVLDLIAEQARLLLRASFACIATPALEPGMLTLRAVRGSGAESLRGTTFPRTGSLVAEVIRKGESIRVASASGGPGPALSILPAPGLDQAVLAPLAAPARTLGTLCVGNPNSAPPFTDSDETVVRHFAAEAAIVLEYSRAQSELGRLMVFEEHARISRDLHDGVIQSLFALGMSLRTTGSILDQPDLAQRRLAATLDHVDEIITDIRAYIFGLKPHRLTHTLDAGIRSLVDDVAAQTPITMAVDIDPDALIILDAHAADVLHILQEALSNVGRHANALTCRVSVQMEAGAVALTIDDDGRGFEPGALPAPTGLGLVNLARRAESLGGRIEVTSMTGEGTTVRLIVPISAPPAAQLRGQRSRDPD